MRKTAICGIASLEDNTEMLIQHLTEVPILCPANWTSRSFPQEERQTSVQRLM